MIIVNCKKKTFRAWYYLQLSAISKDNLHFFFTIYKKQLNKKRERFSTHIMTLSQ